MLLEVFVLVMGRMVGGGWVIRHHAFLVIRARISHDEWTTAHHAGADHGRHGDRAQTRGSTRAGVRGARGDAGAYRNRRRGRGPGCARAVRDPAGGLARADLVAPSGRLALRKAADP